MQIKSKEFMEGFTAACCYAIDVFESRSDAIYKRKWLRRKDISLVVAILDALFRNRNLVAEYGPRRLNLVAHSDGSFEFVEKDK